MSKPALRTHATSRWGDLQAEASGLLYDAAMRRAIEEMKGGAPTLVLGLAFGPLGLAFVPALMKSVFWLVERSSLTAEISFQVPTSLSFSSATAAELAARAWSARIVASIICRVMIFPIADRERLDAGARHSQGTGACSISPASAAC